MTEALVEPAPLPSLTFHVRGAPLGQNRAWRIITIPVKGGRPHASLKLTDEGKAFKLEVARLAAMACPREWDRDNEYVVTAVYFFESRRPDVDGPGKLVLDALGEFDIDVKRNQTVHFDGFYKNDRQVWRFNQQREKDADNPRAEITIRMRRPPMVARPKPQQGALL